MVPIPFIVLLILVTLPGELAETAGGNLPTADFLPVPVAFASFFLAHLLLVLFVLARTRRALRLMHDPGSYATDIAHRTEILFARARWWICGITGVHLFATPLPRIALGWFEYTLILKYLLLPELFFLAPGILAWLAIGIAAYHLEEAMRQRALPYQLARGQPVHDMPSLGGFLAMHIRHNFFPLIFLFFQGFVTLLAAVITHYSHADPKGDLAQIIATGMTGITLFFALPWLLTRIWSTTPLTGPLRERLDAVARLYGLRFRKILIWRTQNLIINAAVIGWLPRTRYFLMTDDLLETCSDAQLESVFAHEVGHGMHRHLPWLVVAFAGAATLATGITGLSLMYLPIDSAWRDMLTLGVSSVLLCVFVAGAILQIAPRFENQADWFACRHMALRLRQATLPEIARLPLGGPGAAELLPAPLQSALAATPTAAEAVTVPQYRAGLYPHSPTAPLAPAPATVPSSEPLAMPMPNPEVAGTEIFISALDSLMDASHRDRDRGDWFHPSVSARAALLRRLALDPAAEPRFARAMSRTRWAIVALALLGIATFTAAMRLDPGSGPPQEPPAATHP